MSKKGIWLIGAWAAFGLPLAAQSVADPFTQNEGRILEGRIQNMVASRDYFILHRVIGGRRASVECWVEGQLTVSWLKEFVSVGSPIVIAGRRVAFTAAETEPTSKSVGLHIYHTDNGQRIAYHRGLILGQAGRFIAMSGDSIIDLEDGSIVFGIVSSVRHVRFLATIGDKFLLLVSQAPDWSAKRLALYDPAAKTDVWAAKTIAPEVTEFFDQRINPTGRGGYRGFPVLFAEDVGSKFGPVFKFLLLKEDGQASVLSRTSFGLAEPKPLATVDFSHWWSSPNGPLLVAGINTRHLGGVDGEKIVISVFNASGTKLAQTALDPKIERLAWTGLDPAGRLLAFVNRFDPRPRDFIVSFSLPSLARTEVESRYNAQFNSPPGLIAGELFFWTQERIYPPGVKTPPRAKLWRTLVCSLNPATAALQSYYPFDESVWQLMNISPDKFWHVHNDVHLFLPFKSADDKLNRSLVLPLRVNAWIRGWLNATFSISPEPVYTDSDETISYTPAEAVVTVNTGKLDGLKWRSPSYPNTTWFTVTLGPFSQMFNVNLLARPVNQPPKASFKVPPRAESALWDVPVQLDAGASSDPDGKVVSYAWDFGDQTPAATSPAAVVSHEFRGGGSFYVKLTVTDDKGATGTATRVVNVPRTIDYDGNKRSGPVSVGLATTAGYDIEITTGTDEGAGTNAAVYVALYGGLNADGEREGTSEFYLYDTIDESYSDAFENGQTDVFRSHQGLAAGLADSSSLENIEFITVRHDNAKSRPGWYVKSVKVRNQVNKKEWFFEPDAWLDWNEAPLKSVMGKFTPLAGEYPRGILFGGAARSWKMTEASDSLFILEPGADKFYFTTLDKANQIEVFLNNGSVGLQYGWGSGLATAPYIPKGFWGVERLASSITTPTKFTVKTTYPNSSTDEAVVWVFPSSWKGYEAEARSAALLYPLKGSTSFFNYAETVIQYMGGVYTFQASLDAALAVVTNYSATALGIFGGPGDSALKGTVEERVGLFVASRLNDVLKAVGLTLASAVVGQTIDLFQAMIRAREWAEQLYRVQADAAAAAGGLQYLGRLAACNPNLLAAREILRLVKTKIDEAIAALDQNAPALYRSKMAEVRELAVGKNPASALPSDYLIDYGKYGINISNMAAQDKYCLSMLCLLELNNIQGWKNGGIGPCFTTDVLIQWTDEEKRGETRVAMVTYEPLWKNIMIVAGVAISIALLL